MTRIYSRAGLRLLFALLWSFPLFGQSTVLQPGRVVVRDLPALDAPRLFNGPDGFYLEVTDDAVEVEFRLSAAPAESNLSLHSRFGQDVMRQEGELVADYTSDESGGAERIIINQNTVPPLEPGRYYVAIEAGNRNPQTFAFLETSVVLRSGATDLITISANDFETFQAEGWTRNFPGPEPFVDGSTLGDPASTIQAIRLPNRSRALQITTQGNDAFVAPSEYLGNLSLLGPQMRIEFDIAYEGAEAAAQNIEVRLLGPGGTFRWLGPKPTDLMQHVVAVVEPSLWQRLGGTGTFAETLENVLRIEIRADFGAAGTKTTLDNVALLGKAVQPLIPAKTEFTSGAEGWLTNVPDAPFLQPRIEGATQGDFRTSRNGVRWLGTDGNPGGLLRVQDFEDANRDALLAPAKYLGDWAALGPQARLELDRRHTSSGGASRGVELRIIGFGGAYAWVGAAPQREWSHYSAPLQPGQWALVAGTRTFAEVLRAVQRVEVSMDEIAGPEISEIDNFQIVVPAAVNPQLSAEPQSLLVFNTTQGAGTPTPKLISLASNSVQLQWFAAASTDASWIQLSRIDGQTPGEIAVTANPAGLPVGVHRGFVEFAWIGSTNKVQVPVSLNIVSATGPLISQGGVVNAASSGPNSEPGGELTGGMFIAIYGQRLAERTEQAAQIPLPTSLGGTSVSIGGITAPLTFASDRQINAVVPQSLTQQADDGQVTEADVVVIRGSEFSPGERVRLARVRPVLFSQDQTGAGPGAIQNVLGGGQVQLNTFADPARPLETITVYGTGFGPTQTRVLDGFAATGPTPLQGSARLVVGGVDAQVMYAGLSGLPHLYQVNATLNADTPLGCEVPVRVIIDSVESNTVTVSVTRNGEPCQ